MRPDGSQRRRLPVRNLVIAAGGLESTRLLLAAQRDAPNRFGGIDGPLGRYYMGHVIGDIAEIVFSNAALAGAFDYFVDAHGSYVRRRFVPSQSTAAAREDPEQRNVPDNSSGGRCQTRQRYPFLGLPRSRLPSSWPAHRGRRYQKSHVPPEPVDLAGHLLNVVKGLPSAIALSSDFLWRRYLTKARLPGFFIRSETIATASRIIRNRSRSRIAE